VSLYISLVLYRDRYAVLNKQSADQSDRPNLPWPAIAAVSRGGLPAFIAYSHSKVASTLNSLLSAIGKRICSGESRSSLLNDRYLGITSLYPIRWTASNFVARGFPGPPPKVTPSKRYAGVSLQVNPLHRRSGDCGSALAYPTTQDQTTTSTQYP